jgi:predicted RNase H-like HicB family nuclease
MKPPPKKNPLVFEVQVYFEKEEGGGFHTYVPALRGLHSCGDTIEEAKHNTKDAIVAYLTSLIKHGDPIPLTCVYTKKSARKNATSVPAPSMAELFQVSV